MTAPPCRLLLLLLPDQLAEDAREAEEKSDRIRRLKADHEVTRKQVGGKGTHPYACMPPQCPLPAPTTSDGCRAAELTGCACVCWVCGWVGGQVKVFDPTTTSGHGFLDEIPLMEVWERLEMNKRKQQDREVRATTVTTTPRHP